MLHLDAFSPFLVFYLILTFLVVATSFDVIVPGFNYGISNYFI